MSKAPFITGSHAYGEPRPDSDIDLVVWAEGDTRKVLEADGYPVRFGKLNLILIDDEEQWEIWRQGTSDLVIESAMSGSPISRERAVEYLKAKRVTQGQKYSDRGTAEDEFEARHGL